MRECAFRYDDVRVAPSEQVGLDSHDSWEVSMVVTGAGTRTIGDRTEPMREGEVVLIPPGIPHVWKFDPKRTDADGNIANISVFFKTGLLHELRSFLPEIGMELNVLLQQDEAVVYTGSIGKQIGELLTGMRGLTESSRLPRMLELLDLLTFMGDCKPAGRHTQQTKTELRMERVRVYCECNMARGVKLAEVAAHVGMNKSAFCTFIRQRTGKSLSEYVNMMRIMKAYELLWSTDESIAEIAYGLGFTNVSYFNRLFKKIMGRTPKYVRDTPTPTPPGIGVWG